MPTVAEELERRDGCRYGLRGVLVRLNDVEYRIWSTHWLDTGGKYDIGLVLIPRNEFNHYAANLPTTMTGAELVPWKPNYPVGTIETAESAQCILASPWPEVCGCYKKEPSHAD